MSGLKQKKKGTVKEEKYKRLPFSSPEQQMAHISGPGKTGTKKCFLFVFTFVFCFVCLFCFLFVCFYFCVLLHMYVLFYTLAHIEVQTWEVWLTITREVGHEGRSYRKSTGPLTLLQWKREMQKLEVLEEDAAEVQRMLGGGCSATKSCPSLLQPHGL